MGRAQTGRAAHGAGTPRITRARYWLTTRQAQPWITLASFALGAGIAQLVLRLT